MLAVHAGCQKQIYMNNFEQKHKAVREKTKALHKYLCRPRVNRSTKHYNLKQDLQTITMTQFVVVLPHAKGH